MRTDRTGAKGTGCQIDGRDRQDILDEIGRLARSFVPEWKFDPACPDAAAVIAMIFADQMAENIRHLDQVWERYHAAFADMYGVSLKPAVPARTICTLKVGERIQDGVRLRRGTRVIGTTDRGEEVLFTFMHDICAVHTRLTDVLAISGTGQRAVSYGGGVQEIGYGDMEPHPLCERVPERFPLFCFDQGKAVHRQALVLYFRSFPSGQDRTLRLRFRGELPDAQLAGLFADAESFSFSYLAQQGIRPFQAVSASGAMVEVVGAEELSAVILELKKPVEADIVLTDIALFAPEGRVRPEFLWDGRNEASGESVLAFTRQPALYQEFMIGHHLLLGQAGAVVTLHFDLSFGRYAPQSTSGSGQELRMIRRRPRTESLRPRPECRIQEVALEYFNGRGWRRLSADRDLSALFSSEDNAGSIQASFQVPDDWEPTIQGGYEGRCIRIQIVRADNCYLPDAESVYPVLSDIWLQAGAQEKGTAPERVVRIQGGTMEEMARGSGAFMRLPYQGDCMYWGFDRSFGEGPASLLIELEQPSTLKGVALSFSYSAQNGFKPLKVIDRTDAFQATGLLMFMPPADMAPYEVEGVKRYWIMIEDRERRFSQARTDVPVIRSVHVNGVLAENRIELDEQEYHIDRPSPHMRFPLYAQNILSAQVWVNEKEQLSAQEMRALMDSGDGVAKVEYDLMGRISEFYVLWHEVERFDGAAQGERCYCIDRRRNELVFGDGVHVRIPQALDGPALKTVVTCCDGAKANVRAGSIDRFQSLVIPVEAVTDPIDAYGGTDLETVQGALERAGALLSSRRRLVSEQDHVREALAFSDAVAQASCVTGWDGDGQKDERAVSLVLLMKDHRNGDHSFRSLQEPLRAHLLRCCEAVCGASGIDVVRPVFVRISVDVWIDIPDLSESFELRRKWLDALTDFLEPVRDAGRSGWPIGRLPGTGQIRSMLNTLESTAALIHISAQARYAFQGRTYEMSLDAVDVHPFMACCNGEHHIYIKNAG